MRSVLKHLTYGNVVASLALFIALGGAGYAATKLPKNSVGSAQLKAGAVANADLAANAVTGVKVKAGSLDGTDLRSGSIGAAQINVAGLPAVPAAATATTADSAKTAASATTATTATTANAATALAKVTYRTSVGELAPGEAGQAVASCPAGQVVTGGGVEVEDYTEQWTIESHPQGTAAWAALVASDPAAAAPRSFTVTAICVPASATG